jgi:hypothetical protein
MTVAGPSQSGKTHFVSSVIRFINNLVHPVPSRIIYCYSICQDSFKNLMLENKNVEFKNGIYDEDVIENCVIILDDLMTDCIDNKEIVRLFTVGSHHRNASVIFLTQNIFEKGKYARAISLNSHYLVLFNNRRDLSQVMHLGRQLYPGETGFFTEVFNDAISSQPYGYLIIDLMPKTDDSIRLRSYNFDTNDIFVFKKNLFQ